MVDATAAAADAAADTSETVIASSHSLFRCELHPRLEVVAIPGAGLGIKLQRDGGGSLPQGTVLLTESAFCAGPLDSNGNDEEAVSRFIERIKSQNQNIDHDECDKFYTGLLSVATLTTTISSESKSTNELDHDEEPESSDVPTEPERSPIQPQDQLLDRTWVQQCLDNNMYQCRREPNYAALFVALSRFNHSCDPNAINDASRDMAVVRVVRPIDEGDEIYISYVPVGQAIGNRRTAGFGFVCHCHRCARERIRDPSFGTQCTECYSGVCTMMPQYDSALGKCGDDNNNDIGDDPFSDGRAAAPCLNCGSCSALGGNVSRERHAAVVAALISLQRVLHRYDTDNNTDQNNNEDSSDDNDNNDDGDNNRLQILAEAQVALTLAPFSTHPDTLRLHRGVVRLLLQIHHTLASSASASSDNIHVHTIAKQSSNNNVILGQLREIRRLDQAHGGVKHRDLNFLRCFARVIKRCRGSEKACSDDNDTAVHDLPLPLHKHVETRWNDLCQIHFGASVAPATFINDIGIDDDDIDDNGDTIDVHFVPIGCNGERIALYDGDDEIDLSGHEIGDEGCEVLCSNLSAVSLVSSLDLDSNGITSRGGTALGTVMATGAVPLITTLDLMCNNIGSAGAIAIADAIRVQSCPLLAYLDLHGNNIGDDGAVAIAAVFSTGSAAGHLKHLNLSANGIDDRGCAALSLLFGSRSHCKLEHLDLSENLFQLCAPLFDNYRDIACLDGAEVTSLQYLDLSWNCITDLESILPMLTRTRCLAALETLNIKGNMLSDRESLIFYAKLKASDATPKLEFEDNISIAAEPVIYEDDDDELRLQKCLRSLGEGETINPKVCALQEIWQSKSSPDVESETEPTASAQGPTDISSLKANLNRKGFFVMPQIFQRWRDSGAGNGFHSVNQLASTIDRLELAHWPPVFCFMCDAVWDLVSTRLWDEMRLLLGDDCVLEQSVFAWSLKPPAVTGINTNRIGQSFGLPHRDFSASEALGDDGKTPQLLTVWIPVNDATLENGCMYVVPREFDENFDRPEDHGHMRSATAVRGTSVCKLRFPVNGARALPAQSGSLLVWNGNTIHWGAGCSQYTSSPPRKSIAMTFFRRSSAVARRQLDGNEAGVPITQECARDMSSNRRLALIARSLLLYNQWHTLKSSAVPSVLYDVTTV